MVYTYRRKMKVVVLLLALCCFHQTSGVTHTLQYFYTVSSGISNFPQFIAVGVVDGQQFDYYDSVTKKAVPKTEWIKAALHADYWKSNTEISAGAEANFMNNIEVAKSRFNHSGGIHTYQKMYGCEWDDETQQKNGFRQYGYDGEDFLVYDMKTFQWIAPVQQAEISLRKWNNQQHLEYLKNYITQQCVEWLQKYVEYGKTALQKQVAPEVSLLEKHDASAVACHAAGFYPDQVMITWKRNGLEMEENVDVGETLPNEDGTFQKRAVLTVSPEERKKGQYTCEVAHKSGKVIIKTLMEEDGNTLAIILGIIGVVVAFVVIGGIVWFMKNKRDYNKAEQSDTDSDTSNPIARKGAECGDC